MCHDDSNDGTLERSLMLQGTKLHVVFVGTDVCILCKRTYVRFVYVLFSLLSLLKEGN